MAGLFVAAPASLRGIGGIGQRAPPWPHGCPRGAGHPLRRGRAGMEPLEGNPLLRRGPGLLPCSSPTPCPFLGCLPRYVEEVRRWTGSRAGPVALGIRAGLARVKRGRAGFQSVPPPQLLAEMWSCRVSLLYTQTRCSQGPHGLGSFWVPQNQALPLTEDTSSANNR